MTYFKDNLVDSAINQQSIMAGNVLGGPIYTDATDENNVYLGYCNIDKDLNKETECLIVKVVTANSITTKYFAYGTWANRATLQYK